MGYTSPKNNPKTIPKPTKCRAELIFSSEKLAYLQKKLYFCSRKMKIIVRAPYGLRTLQSIISVH